MKAAVQVLRKAEELKQQVSGDILGDNESWNNHQRLQDLYQQLLLIDLEYALDKKVEQDLWNYVFKNQINVLQTQAKDRKNPQRTESQENLVWFLEASSGFYLQLIQELCETFDLDISCRRKGSSYGMPRETQQSRSAIAPPHKSSCLYICQHCLVHLGDIARYRNQSLQAETFYRHAAELVPSNGQPYNQLAILEAAKGDKLSTVFYYVRSIAVKYPFPVAATNLQKMFSKIANDEFQHDGKNKLSVYDYVTAFLQFHSLVHLTADLSKAQKLGRVLATNLTILIATESLSAWKLIQMTAINLFAVAHATRGLDATANGSGSRSSPSGSSGSGPVDKPSRDTDTEVLSEDEQTVYNLVLELIASMLNGLLLLVYTMKDRAELKAYYALPVVKLILDWLRQDLSHLKATSFTSKLQIWPSLCKLLNAVQSTKVSGFDMNKYADVPLPEDWDLQSFVSMERAHRPLRFRDSLPPLAVAEEQSLRARRLVALGRWLCEQQVYGVRLMTVATPSDKQGGNSLTAATPLHFEPVSPQTPSGDVLEQLEAVVVVRRSLDNDGEVAIDDNSQRRLVFEDNDDEEEVEGSGAALRGKSRGNKMVVVEPLSPTSPDGTATFVVDKEGGQQGAKENHGHRMGVRNGGRERKTRQNVALQTIMQKKNIITKSDSSEDHYAALKPKSEGKQVTFKTPSPSPPASSGGTPPLQPQLPTATSPIFQGDMSCFPPLLQQQQQQSYPGPNHHHHHPQQQHQHQTKGGPSGYGVSPLREHPISVEHNGGTPLLSTVSPNANAAHARIVYANLQNSDHTYQLNSAAPPPKFGYYGANGGSETVRPYAPIPPPPVSGPGRLSANNQQQQQVNGMDVTATGVNGHQHHQGARMADHLSSYPPPPLVFGYQALAKPVQPTGSANPHQGTVNGGLNQKMHHQEQQQHFTMPAPPLYNSAGGWFAPPPPPAPPIAMASFKPPPNLDQLLAQLSNQQRNPMSAYPGQSPPQNQQPGYGAGNPRFPIRDVNPYVYHLMAGQMAAEQMPYAPYGGGQQQQAHGMQSSGGNVVTTRGILAAAQPTGGVKLSNGMPEVGYDGAARPAHSPGTPRPDKHQHHHPGQQQMPEVNGAILGSGGKMGSEVGGGQAKVNGEGVTSTYSLFNSPWSSGLNLANVGTKDHENTNNTISVSKDLGGFLQPSLHSLWSGPGPSPLERLLEQQKQKKDPAPH